MMHRGSISAIINADTLVASSHCILRLRTPQQVEGDVVGRIPISPFLETPYLSHLPSPVFPLKLNERFVRTGLHIAPTSLRRGTP
jgi:hypothetical protein